MKFLKHLLFALALLGAPVYAQTVHTPTLEGGPWIWQGINTFSQGNLRLNNAYPACASNTFVDSISSTFQPHCSAPVVLPVSSAIVYPGQCQGSNPPAWCGATGQSPDVYIREACGQLPSTGGFINLLGLTGNAPNAITGCSSPNKQVIFLEDPTSQLTITENDGGIWLPLDNNSMLIGPGAGQCNFSDGGIHLGGSANVTAIVGPAHVDGTQEDFTVDGACLYGANGSTVSKGLIYAKEIFTNTTVSNTNAQICESACLWMEDVGGMVNVGNNEFNPTDGLYTVVGSPIVLMASGAAGCENQSINVWGSNFEHANGGANYPDVKVASDGGGALTCGLYMHDIYVERNVAGTPNVDGIDVTDCVSCNFANIEGGGGNGTPSGDLIHISQSAANRTQNVVLTNISNVYGTYSNTLNDTVKPPSGFAISYAQYPQITNYFVAPGYVVPPVLPPTTMQALGSDAMSGAGNFATGSGSLGSGFVQVGCNASLTCTYTRTNSTAPPGLTYSQEIQITANTDSSEGYNGVQYGTSTPVSFTAGQSYVASFWAKSDGVFVGYPAFVLGDYIAPTYYCSPINQSPMTSTWTAYSFVCTPTASGSSNISISAATPSGNTGTFWLAGFTFAPIAPLQAGSLLTALSPYGIGPASASQQTLNVNGAACQLGSASCTLTLFSAAGTPLPTCNASSKGTQYTVSDATSPTWHGTYTSGGSITSQVICSYNGSTYSWLTQ